MDSNLVPSKETQVETHVVNSHFIASLAPAFSVEEARAFIDRIKTKYPDATHHVPAYIIGHGASVTAHCNDDGEPSGTAGKPALAVLRGSDLGDVVVVVTRYFGGTKLGKGGLVRAYSDAVRAVLEQTPRACKVNTDRLKLRLPYPLFERVRLLIQAHNAVTLEEEFGVQVLVDLRIASKKQPSFSAAIQELSAGTITPEIVAQGEVALLPLPGS